LTVPAILRDRPLTPRSKTFEAERLLPGLRCSELAELETTQRGPVVLLEIHGDLDETLVARVRESVFSAAAASPRRIVIDLADVSFVDGIGLRTLIAARRRCAGGPTTLTLRSPSRSVRRLLSRTHLDTVFDVEEQADAEPVAN
jgi:anti-sigma B factor antagonist